MSDDGPAKVAVPWAVPFGKGDHWSSAEPHPLHALSESLQSQANSLVLHAKDNPHVSRLVSGYEIWESRLRQEARQRLAKGLTPAPLHSLVPPVPLHSFVPPVPLGSASDNWETLWRGHHSLVSPGSTGGTPRGGGGTVVGIAAVAEHSGDSSGNSGGSAGMKRSHSENSGFVSSGTGSWRHGAVTSHPGMQDVPGGPHRMLVRRQPVHTHSESSLKEFVHPLSDEASLNNLEAVASSIIQEGISHARLAISHAHRSIRQTAVNCQQNLSMLQSLLQNGLAASGAGTAFGPVRPLGSSEGGMSLQPFAPVSFMDLLNSNQSMYNVLPRPLFPRYGWGRENGDGGEEETGPSSSQWLAPFHDYLDQLSEGFAGAAVAPAKVRRPLTASLRDPGRQVAIVTTASLPWMTGTAVNPLLRAAYLANDSDRQVTLVLPWLAPVDQERVFPNNVTFESPEDQEQYVREWARKRTGLGCNFKVAFYPGRYAAEKGSILPVGDVTTCIPDNEADVAVLEEPEHLNWYQHGRRWTDKFNHVVGVMHTNYLDYTRREEGGELKEKFLRHINEWVCRVHCHKVIKLSDAVQELPRQETMFVHGVSPAFLQVGRQKAEQAVEAGQGPSKGRGTSEPNPTWRKGAYFLGKVVWAKGYTELIERLKEHSSRCGENVPVDVYGSGPDLSAVKDEAGKYRLDLQFNAARDHADEALQDYKVFINPSLSDVVATTTAEALAMGKFVVCADHPSNQFFKAFPNCLVYRDSEEFSRCVRQALAANPAPLSPADLHKLTWEAATERFLQVAQVKSEPPLWEAALDNVLAVAHNVLTGFEPMRVFSGAGANTRDAPARLTDYRPEDSVALGWLDDPRAAEMRQQALERNAAAAAAAAADATAVPTPVDAKASSGATVGDGNGGAATAGLRKAAAAAAHSNVGGTADGATALAVALPAAPGTAGMGMGSGESDGGPVSGTVATAAGGTGRNGGKRRRTPRNRAARREEGAKAVVLVR